MQQTWFSHEWVSVILIFLGDQFVLNLDVEGLEALRASPWQRCPCGS